MCMKMNITLKTSVTNHHLKALRSVHSSGSILLLSRAMFLSVSITIMGTKVAATYPMITTEGRSARGKKR